MQGDSPMENGQPHTEQAARRIVFRGEVQGVGFRYTSHRIARRYGVTGYVRNQADGSVEMFIQGPAREIDNCLADIRDAFDGYIRDVQTEEAPFDIRYRDFRIAF
jgi:acylphosphatase